MHVADACSSVDGWMRPSGQFRENIVQAPYRESAVLAGAVGAYQTTVGCIQQHSPSANLDKGTSMSIGSTDFRSATVRVNRKINHTLL